MATLTFRGLIVPVFTPFNNDQKRTLNLGVIPAYAQHLATAGVTGVAVCATSGEGMSMSVQERKLVTEAWVQACKQTKQHVMVQVGGAPLPDVIELAQHAEQKGVNSLLCLPDLYQKPKTSADLIHYFEVIAQAAPNTPLLYYHIPSFTNVNIHMGKFLNEVAERVPTFSGIKFTSTDLDEGAAAVKANNGKFGIFLGADMVMAGACALGFDSAIAITLNIFPQHLPRIVQLINEGKVKEARDVQNELNSYTDVITRNGTWVPAVKAAMKLMTPIDLGPPREPLSPLLPNHVKQMETELKSLKLI